MSPLRLPDPVPAHIPRRVGLALAAAGVATLLTLAGAAVAQPGATPAASAPARTPAQIAAIDLGRRTYLGLCARCHGANLVPAGGIGADLRRFPADGRERFRTSVTRGLRAMPGFGTTVSPAQLDGLWAYLASVNGWPQP